MTETDPTKRFSTRVDNYIRYRPKYPLPILSYLIEDFGLSPDATIADIGSGTGILSELFLTNGNTVIGVEPNDDMRHGAERLLGGDERFKSIDGTAERSRM